MKKLTSLFVSLVLGLGLISLAVPAQAVSPSVHTVTPTTQDPNKQLSIGASVSVPAIGQTDNVITHTWPANRLNFVEATAPDGWLIEYKTSSGWSATKPSDLSTLIGIRTLGTIDSYGVTNGKQKLQTTATSIAAPGSAGTFVSASRGDGWGGFTSKKYLLNVYHHDGNYRLECHLKLTGELCGDLYQVNNFGTSRVSGGFVANEKAYSFVADWNNGGAVAVICTDVSTLPFTSCGVTDIDGTSDISATNDLSSEAFDGRRIWAADFQHSRLFCFDTQTEALCENQADPINGLSRTEGTPGYLSFIGGKIFLSAEKLYCFTPETAAPCSGSWPVAVAGYGPRTGVVPHVTTNGVQDGVCSIVVSFECFAFDGSLLTTPSGFQSLLTTPATKLSGGNSYWQTTAWSGTRLIWQSNPDGSDWASGRATCYDWATDSPCAGFDSTVDIGARRYSLALDPNNNLCVLANGDDGNIFAFDINTGEKGCVNPDDAKALFKASAIAPQISCTSDGNIRSFDSITLTAPEGLNTADLRLTVKDKSRQDIDGYIDLTPDANGTIDLSALSIDIASNDFQFIVTASGMTLDQATKIQARLRYTADLPELCVKVSVKADCPDVWGSRIDYAQPTIAISSSTVVTPSGGSPVFSTQSTTVTVNPAKGLDCATLQGLAGPDNQGVNGTGDASQIVTMAWSPEGQLYVGGVFKNAGGDPNADFLARWNGNNWEAVGPSGNVDDGFTPAIQSRVAAIVFDKSGNLIVGGNFDNAGGIDSADKVAIFNPSTNTWSAPTLTGPFNGQIRSMAVNPDTGKIVVGGTFWAVNGDSANRYLVELNPDDNYSVSTLNPGSQINNYVHFTTYGPDKKLYIGGWFGAFGGATAATFDGTTWSSLPQNFDAGDAVRAIAFSGTKMFVAGNFTGVRVYDSSDDSWSWLGGSQDSVAGSVRSLLVSSTGDLYIGGNFKNFNSARVIRYTDGEFFPLINSANGAVDFDYLGIYGEWGGVWDIAESPQGQIYLAGDFQNAGGNANADYIAVYASGAIDLAAPSGSPTPSASPSPSQSSASPSPTPSIKTQIVKPASGTELSMGTGSQTPSPANSPETETLGKVGPGEGAEFTSEYGAANNSPDAGFFNDVRLGSGKYNDHYVPFDYAQMIQFAPLVIGQAACQDFTFTYRIYPSGTDVSEITFTDDSYLDTATVTVMGDPSICASPSPSPSESESASPSPSPSESESASPTPTPSITPVPTSTKLPSRPEDKNLTGLVVKAETKIKEPSIDVPAPSVVVAAKSLVDLAPAVSTAYKVHGNEADRGLVTIPTNTVIQADTSLFAPGDVVNAYLQSPNGIYFSLGENISLDGPLVLQPMRFLKPGRYEIIVTQVAEVVHFKRHYVKAPTFGKKTTRIVVYVIPPKATVHFDFCKYNLSKKAKADLKELAVRLRGAGVVTIVGYTQTDLTSPASRAANKVLSVNRAKTVAAYLRKQGLHVRMIIVGKGATNPVSVEHQYKNRRVTITYGF